MYSLPAWKVRSRLRLQEVQEVRSRDHEQERVCDMRRVALDVPISSRRRDDLRSQRAVSDRARRHVGPRRGREPVKRLLRQPLLTRSVQHFMHGARRAGGQGIRVSEEFATRRPQLQQPRCKPRRRDGILHHEKDAQKRVDSLVRGRRRLSERGASLPQHHDALRQRGRPRRAASATRQVGGIRQVPLQPCLAIPVRVSDVH
mmetsp:Transcript_45779/g.91863  ORF Transcript_45779/g.91863 Transcript_45779/m.91863 type:complete len:202 (-) Transcript_45779:489-1094(-)